jgi:hypothetical protein
MKTIRFAISILGVFVFTGGLWAQVSGKVFSVMASNQTDSPLRVRALSTTDDSMARSVKLKNFGEKHIVSFKLGYSIFIYDGQTRVAQGNLISKEEHAIDQLFDVDVEPGESVVLSNVSLLGRAEALQSVSSKNRLHHYVFVFGVKEVRFEDGSYNTYELLKEENFKSRPNSKSPQAASPGKWIIAANRPAH